MRYSFISVISGCPFHSLKRAACCIVAFSATFFNVFSESLNEAPDSIAQTLPDEIPLGAPLSEGHNYDVVINEITAQADSLTTATAVDTIPVVTDEWVLRPVTFNPDPTRAVWMSALCPGLGQIYNRRYWKLPIVVGGYLGLAYATSWNNTMLTDYTRAFADLTDNNPDTKSYMDFFPPGTIESSLDKKWLNDILRSRKNFYRRNRDLCIICMFAVYFVAMVDAYVDASLAHFDISPDLSVNWAPAVIPDSRNRYPAVGLHWALNF